MIFVSEKIDETAWKGLIIKSSTANFFQTKECFDFYSSLSFMEAFVFGVLEDKSLKGIIVGYIQKDGGKLKQYFSRRAIIIGGALLADDISDKALSELLVYCRNKLSKKAIYVEFRNFNDYSLYKGIFQKNGFEYVPHLNFHIDCSSNEIINRNLSKAPKRYIKTSLRDGAICINNPTIDELYDFYMILKKLYATKVKTPLFPFEFFEKLYKVSFSRFLFIKFENKIIGGLVAVCLDNRTIYEWFVCGIDNKYKTIYPSILATYSGIKYANENGISRFDLMGAGKPDEKYGVRDFKAKFGGELVEHGRFLCVLNPVLYHIGKIGVKILKGIK